MGMKSSGKTWRTQVCTRAYTNTLWLIKTLENLAINRKRDNYLLWARAVRVCTEKVWEKKMWKKRWGKRKNWTESTQSNYFAHTSINLHTAIMARLIWLQRSTQSGTLIKFFYLRLAFFRRFLLCHTPTIQFGIEFRYFISMTKCEGKQTKTPSNGNGNENEESVECYSGCSYFFFGLVESSCNHTHRVHSVHSLLFLAQLSD